jgi:hypothetical protein
MNDFEVTIIHFGFFSENLSCNESSTYIKRLLVFLQETALLSMSMMAIDSKQGLMYIRLFYLSFKFEKPYPLLHLFLRCDNVPFSCQINVNGVQMT